VQDAAALDFSPGRFVLIQHLLCRKIGAGIVTQVQFAYSSMNKPANEIPYAVSKTASFCAFFSTQRIIQARKNSRAKKPALFCSSNSTKQQGSTKALATKDGFSRRFGEGNLA
jgi:hypothetical protein